MTLLLYAITDREHVTGDGLCGAPLVQVRGSGLGAVVSHQPAPAPEQMWEYERVVESLMTSGAILPARFGTVLQHEDAVQGFLSERRDELARGLDRVRGAVEMGVRVQWVDDAETESGTAYMLGRLALLRAAREIAQRLAPLRTVARLGKVAVMPRRGVAVLAAYLVEHHRVDEFADRCQRLTDELAPAELTCTGPWPPYSFSGDGADE